ncbi:hypothetical protein HHI36_009524 [Cryptolaemus montrouzieri]|uniref:Uncharacterized protein n=1 Tax=Cryptolaemus montrouzieri TaxID=559131 RepID=A0ABD2MGQ9_9CUCU
MNHEIKKEETNSELTQRVAVENILEKVPVDELLGSVTTYPEGNDKYQSLRSSARVFKKIKLDANLNASLTTSSSVEKIATEKKDDQKLEQLSQKEQKKLKPTWSAEDRVLFFEALNEYGKDFENIHSYMIQKLKKKGVPDGLLITKEHVRHLYYKTWHKISKYLKFSEGTKKAVQELYGLINYGELRKKVGMFTQKINHKLNELIHNGCVAIRVKGKMVRIKTPMCAALRRLNKLDEKDDDLKLPSKVIVELRPRDMSSFLKVQNMALNPRIRTELPLQKKLSTLITCISKKWKAAEIEYLKNVFPKDELMNGETQDEIPDIDACLMTSQLTFTPPKGTKVNMPKVNVNEYFTCESVCLRAFEERMSMEKKENKKQKSRTDNITENIAKSPVKPEIQESEVAMNQVECDTNSNLHTLNNNTLVSEENKTEKGENCSVDSTGDKLIDEALNNFFSSIGSESEKSSKLDLSSTPSSSKHTKATKEPDGDLSHVQETNKFGEINDNNKSNKNISTEEQFSKLEKIQNGWTVEDCDSLTIGELYLMFGSASKIILEYHWSDKNAKHVEMDVSSISDEDKSIKKNSTDSLKENFAFSEVLRKLVSVVKLHQKKPTPKCPCGHVCSPKNAVTKKSHNKSVGDIEEKNIIDETVLELDVSHSIVNGEDHKQKNSQFDEFLKPQPKPPPVHLMAQLDSIQKLKPKYTVRKGRRLRTKQLVVERELPLTPTADSAHQIVRMNIISQNSSSHQSITSVEEIHNQSAECEMNCLVGDSLYIPVNGTHSSEEREDEPNLILNANMNVPMKIVDGIPVNDNLSVFLNESSRSLSPSGILKENANHWISSEVGDFSLSSFLGHLGSPMKSQDDESHDVDAQVRSLLTENSFDYTAKFADLASKVTGDTTN